MKPPSNIATRRSTFETFNKKKGNTDGGKTIASRVPPTPGETAETSSPNKK